MQRKFLKEISIQLIEPNVKYLNQIQEYMLEIETNEDIEGTNGLYKAMNENTFEHWLERIKQSNSDTYFIENNKKVVGVINIRYVLNDALKKCGGNIGYNIRPSERRKGYAKQALLLALEKCYQYGLTSIIIDCYKGNDASKKTIESCGAEFIKEEYIEDRKKILLRYFVNLEKIFNKNYN